MRDFQEFINKKIAVTFADKKELRAFLELCKENNMTWRMRAPATEPLSDCIWFKKILTKSIRHEGVLFYSEPEYYKRSGHEIIPAAEFLTQSTPTIEIFQSKQTVVCLKKQDGKVVAVGKAKCNPEDEFDFEYGATLAFQRMIGLKPTVEDSSIKTLKNGMKIRKQDKYEVGDRVLIKKEWKSCYKKSLSSPNAISLLNSVRKITGASGGAYLVPTNNDRSFYILGKDIKGKVIS